MMVCKPFGPTLSHEKSQHDAESNIMKSVPNKQKTSGLVVIRSSSLLLFLEPYVLAAQQC